MCACAEDDPGERTAIGSSSFGVSYPDCAWFLLVSERGRAAYFSSTVYHYNVVHANCIAYGRQTAIARVGVIAFGLTICTYNFAAKYHSTIICICYMYTLYVHDILYVYIIVIVIIIIIRLIDVTF